MIFTTSLIFFDQGKLNWVNQLWGMNPYQRLAQVSGLDINALDFTSCQEIEKNSEFACLELDWPLSEFKKLQQRIAIFDGESWQVVTADEVSYQPQRSVILWQPVAGFKNPVKPGESHSLIAWVRGILADESSLSEWQVIAPDGAPQHNFHIYYDPILSQKVASFQQQAGLKADRIIGLKTLLALQAKSRRVLASDGGI